MITLFVAAICGGSCAAPVQRLVQNVYAPSYAPIVEQLRFVAVEDPYYSNIAAQKAREEIRREEFKANTAALEAELAALTASVTELRKTVASVTVAAPPASEPATPTDLPARTEPTPAPASKPTTPDPDWTNLTPEPSGLSEPTPEALDIMIKKCKGCHAVGKLKNNTFVMFDADGKFADLSAPQRVTIDTVLYGSKMPPSAPLINDEYNTIRLWLNQDADAIIKAMKSCQ